MENRCPICDSPKKESHKYCSYKCRNIVINRNKDYKKQSKKIGDTLRKKYVDKIKIEYIKCSNDICSNQIEIRISSNPNSYKKRFCSIACANIERGKFTESTKNKIKNSLKEYYSNRNKDKPKRFCKLCNIELEKENRNGYCSRICRIKLKTVDISFKSKYKSLASFRFSLNSFPSEFEFELIEKFGWYKPSNRGNNLEGVSRDHMLSVVEGMNRLINPLILSHPANCKLLKHRDNISKNLKSSIDLDNLLEKIEKWNKKYGNYFNNDIKVFIDENDLHDLYIKYYPSIGKRPKPSAF